MNEWINIYIYITVNIISLDLNYTLHNVSDKYSFTLFPVFRNHADLNLLCLYFYLL